MKTVKIRVTKKDIEAGQKSDCKKCPIARAARRALHRMVYVAYGEIYSMVLVENLTGKEYYQSSGEVLCELPKRASAFIGRFDSRRPCKPFEFNVKVAS